MQGIKIVYFNIVLSFCVVTVVSSVMILFSQWNIGKYGYLKL